MALKEALSASEAATHELPIRMISVASEFEKGAVEAANADAATLDANAEPPSATAALMSPPAPPEFADEAETAVGDEEAGVATMALINAADWVSVPMLTLPAIKVVVDDDDDEADAEKLVAPPTISIDAVKSCVRITAS